MSFLSIQLLKELSVIIVFPFNIQFVAFSLYYFFSSKLFLICFLQFFFIKRSNNFFAFKITNNICPRHSIFNFLDPRQSRQGSYKFGPVRPSIRPSATGLEVTLSKYLFCGQLGGQKGSIN